MLRRVLPASYMPPPRMRPAQRRALERRNARRRAGAGAGALPPRRAFDWDGGRIGGGDGRRRGYRPDRVYLGLDDSDEEDYLEMYSDGMDDPYGDFEDLYGDPYDRAARAAHGRYVDPYDDDDPYGEDYPYSDMDDGQSDGELLSEELDQVMAAAAARAPGSGAVGRPAPGYESEGLEEEEDEEDGDEEEGSSEEDEVIELDEVRNRVSVCVHDCVCESYHYLRARAQPAGAST